MMYVLVERKSDVVGVAVPIYEPPLEQDLYLAEEVV
jgi:hypothetical protein